MGRTLYTILTSGNRRLPSGVLGPGQASLLRAAVGLQAAADQALAGPPSIVDVMFLGGKRQDSRSAEARILYGAISEDMELRALLSTVKQYQGRIHCLAEGKYTVADMIALASWLKNSCCVYTRICLVSHPDHCALATATLYSCGIRTTVESLDSGETPPYGAPTLAYLRLLSYLDPQWKGPLAWPLCFLANRRGRNE